MSNVDAIGWVAAALSLAAFSMRTMIPLRITAIFANLCTIAYSALAGTHHTLVLHLVLLPFNVVRLVEMVRLVRDVKRASETDLVVTWLTPFMRRKELVAGAVIFRKGEEADHLYYLAKGRVRLNEIGIELREGELFGEIAFFAPERRRIASAECLGECTIFAISEFNLYQLCQQNPAFGFYLMRLIAKRLSANLASMEDRVIADSEPREVLVGSVSLGSG